MTNRYTCTAFQRKMHLQKFTKCFKISLKSLLFSGSLRYIYSFIWRCFMLGSRIFQLYNGSQHYLRMNWAQPVGDPWPSAGGWKTLLCTAGAGLELIPSSLSEMLLGLYYSLQGRWSNQNQTTMLPHGRLFIIYLICVLHQTQEYFIYT